MIYQIEDVVPLKNTVISSITIVTLKQANKMNFIVNS